MSTSRSRLRCPVCRARFRGTAICSRCGADLTPLMTLTIRAWQARNNARQALIDGDLIKASQWITSSQQLHATDTGRKLELLIRTLGNVPQ